MTDLENTFATTWEAFPGLEPIAEFAGDLTVEIRRGTSCLVQLRLPAGRVKKFGATTVPLPLETCAMTLSREQASWCAARGVKP